MRLFKLLAILCVAFGCAAAPVPARPATEVTVYSFCADVACVNGAFVYPNGAAALTQATNGGLYGTTWGGGAYGYGSVFGMTPSGKLIMRYSFCESSCEDGSNPYFGLVLAPNGDLYGIATTGGAFNTGTVFEITPSGTLTTLHSFCSIPGCADGADPYGGLMLASNGDLYGSTREGGASGHGTIFRITPAGTLTTLYSFSGGADGNAPQAPLIQISNGDLYGSTYYGGAGGNGTILKITPDGGKLTTLYSFTGADNLSQAALVAATNGELYGSSKFGGTYGSGSIYELTPGGELTTLYSFNGADGAWPNSALIQATDGNLYGTTEIGGASGAGTIFMITPAGELSTLFQFGSAYASSGNSLYAGLYQATNGSLYGTTEIGGAAHDGTVYRYATGFAPFVETLPTSGKAGDPIKILGSLISQATGVTFNGTAATFTVVSGTQIDTTVPAGASSGKVEVSTPGATLSSNLTFSVPALPSYDGSELTIPSMEIGNATFSNVVVTVANVLSVGTGTPTSEACRYSPANRQMTLPSVIYGGKAYTNVVITVGRLLSVGSVTGADTYENSVLSIPSVQVLGGSVHTDIMITIAGVISSGGAMPANIQDVYNPANRQLTIAAVQAGNTVYTNAIVTLGEIVLP